MTRRAAEATVEVTARLADLSFPREVELACLSILVEGSPIGEVELPVCDGCLPAGVIADAIAAEHGWTILWRFFQRTLYPGLEHSVRRGEARLWEGEALTTREWHDRIGWPVFLQELWGEPGWSPEWFYSPPPEVEETSDPLPVTEGWTTIEVSRPLPHLVSPEILPEEGEGTAAVALAVGGVVIGGVKVPVPIRAADLRAALTRAGGFELCRAAVREALIGRPLDGPPLRQRLAAHAGAPPAFWTPVNYLTVGSSPRHPIGSAASRRAALPWRARSEILDAATTADLPVGIRGDMPERIVYAPDVLGKPLPGIEPPPSSPIYQETTSRLPILLYHRLAPEGSPETARYRVTPEAFEEQLRHLREAGYRSVRLSEWAEAMARRQPLPGRAVAITFDDGYTDFLTYAWPALQRHGFSATVFLVAGEVGGTNRWDEATLGERLPLLDWDEARRLVAEGVEIGSHSHRHPVLTELSNEEIAREAARSRADLERNLGIPVTAFAYPWGQNDAAVRHLVGGCGYLLGLDSRGGKSALLGNPLRLPRIEITGTDDLASFADKLEP